MTVKAIVFCVCLVLLLNDADASVSEHGGETNDDRTDQRRGLLSDRTTDLPSEIRSSDNGHPEQHSEERPFRATAHHKKFPTLPVEQKRKLDKFRQTLAKQKIHSRELDDFSLIRWINAKKGDEIAAADSLLNMTKWRIQWNVDNVLAWKVPQAFEKYAPYGMSGFDKEGSPIVIISGAGIDWPGMFASMSKNTFIRSVIHALEELLIVASEQGQKYGPQAKQFFVIIDVDQFDVTPYLSYTNLPRQVVRELLKGYEDNYPDILKMAYIINASNAFARVYAWMETILSDYTKSRLKVFKPTDNWLESMMEFADQSQIPKRYLGNQTDDTDLSTDEDPKFQIHWGGMVPMEFHVTADPRDDTYNKTLVKRWSDFKLDFKVQQSGCVLKYAFRALNDDIDFGIKMINEKNEENLVVGMNRFETHPTYEEGSIPLQNGLTYVVIFDNTHSKLRSKDIRHSVKMECE